MKTPQYCQIRKKVGQKASHAAREYVTKFPVTFFQFSNNSWSNGQAPPPPNGKCLSTSLLVDRAILYCRPGMPTLRAGGARIALNTEAKYTEYTSA